MMYLFKQWDKVSDRIKKSPRVFLFFDYDGTLTPIVSTPQEAKFPPRTKALIRKLQKDPKFTIAIISGRSLKDVRRMVGIKGLIYTGNHGLEIEGNAHGITRSRAASARPLIKKIGMSLQLQLRHIKGAKVEDKGYTLSVHFRLVDPAKRILVKDILERVTRPYVLSKKIKLCSGKMVLEVRPGVEWHKGKAVLYLLRKKKNSFPLYIGDDITDTDAFRAIKQKGVSIFVGGSKKGINADYFLKDTKDVKKFIEKLLVL